MPNWYTIENKTTGTDLYIYDEIGGYGVDASQFIDELNSVETSPINVHINSVGGEVFAGLAIYQALKNHPSQVNVIVDALAASIASVISQAGDKVSMHDGAQMMIHDGHTQIAGNASDLSRMVDMLDRTSNAIAQVYADRSGGTVLDWRQAMKAESWYTAQEAVDAGLADEVIKTSKRATRNVADLRIFNYAGRQFAPDPVLNATKTAPSGAKPYGDVEYADPGYQEDGKKRYPIDSEEHVRAAWSYINQEKNASQYSPEHLAEIKKKIKAAAKKFGIEISNSIDFDTQSFLDLLQGAFKND